MNPLDLRLIYLNRVFRLEIVSVSQEPIRIWKTTFSYGYDSIYFHVYDRNGISCFIRRKPLRWTVNVPDFIIVLPGDSHFQDLDLNDGSWDLSECNIDPQTEIDISAVLEIVPDENTAKYEVITGRFESNRLHFESKDMIIH